MGEMAKKTTEKATKSKSFFGNVKAEFRKIIWPSKESLTKESVAVIATTVVLGAIIALVDMGIQYVINTVL